MMLRAAIVAYFKAMPDGSQTVNADAIEKEFPVRGNGGNAVLARRREERVKRWAYENGLAVKRTGKRYKITSRKETATT